MMVTDGGRLIRVPADQVRLTGRASQGVTLFRLDAGEHITSVFPIVDAEVAEGRRPAACGADTARLGVRRGARGRAVSGSAPAFHSGLYPGTFDPITTAISTSSDAARGS